MGLLIFVEQLAGTFGSLAGSAVDSVLSSLVDDGAGSVHRAADAGGLTTATTDPRFDKKGYWRGPQWPPITWLLWWSLVRGGHHRTAATLRATAIDQLRDTGCTEYVEPFSGEPLGSRSQSWTAAVALDWLSRDG